VRKVNNYLGVVLILVWGLAPFYWMVITALRDKRHTFDTTPWPTYVTLQNFREALSTAKGNDFINAIGNSLLIGLLTTVIAVAVGVFTAYALARMEFRGKGFVTGIVLGASMFPGIALVTPLFQLFGDLNWIGQYRALIIPNISFALPLTIYTLTSFFPQMPWGMVHHAAPLFELFCYHLRLLRSLRRPFCVSSPPGMNSCWRNSYPRRPPNRSPWQLPGFLGKAILNTHMPRSWRLVHWLPFRSSSWCWHSNDALYLGSPPAA